MSVIERSERERVAIAIYEARVHTTVINGWDAEPEALRERFRKAADAAITTQGAVDRLAKIAAKLREADRSRRAGNSGTANSLTAEAMDLATAGGQS